jgi:hypothetical protein
VPSREDIQKQQAMQQQQQQEMMQQQMAAEQAANLQEDGTEMGGRQDNNFSSKPNGR